jgi:PAS domain S-box-containing protein
MFKLLRYFSLTSAVAVVAVSVVLLLIYHRSAVNNLVEQAETQNVFLARSFANNLWPHFAAYFKSASGLDGNELRARPETAALDRTVRALTSGIPVLKVKIYNLAGLTVYSSQHEEIGVYRTDNSGFIQSAVRSRPATKLSYRDTFTTFSRVVYGRDVVESYLPIRVGDGPVEGVFELYSDVTQLMDRIHGTIVDLIIGFMVICGFLYGSLVLIVRRADRILIQQYETLADEVAERTQAERALEAARDELEHRVRQRTKELTEEIGERRNAEQALRKLTQAVEQSPAMTIITDLDGNIEYINPRFTAVTGYTPREVVGKNLRFLKSGVMPDEDYDAMWSAIKSGLEWQSEIANRKKNGELYWELLSMSPITGPGGAATHFLAVSEDITARKKIEHEIRQRRNELAHAGRVIIMGEMATSLAHELNQPLTVISGCAQVCTDALRTGGESNRSVEDAVEQIAEQAERATSIIRSIRGFVQKQEPRRSAINVNDVIGGVLDLLSSDSREHRAIIKLEFDDHLPPVMADPAQIQQVILNLAHNGLEAMTGVHSPIRQLTIRTSANGHDAVTTTVIDTGCGIRSDVREWIYEPFFSTKSTGLGMGLSISRSIIEGHGGRLWVASEGQNGTEFCFSLPVTAETTEQ